MKLSNPRLGCSRWAKIGLTLALSGLAILRSGLVLKLHYLSTEAQIRVLEGIYDRGNRIEASLWMLFALGLGWRSLLPSPPLYYTFSMARPHFYSIWSLRSSNSAYRRMGGSYVYYSSD